jgi:hypothetical protein
MSEPTPPDSLPKYLAEGLPKQDIETLEDAEEFIQALIEYKDRELPKSELPDTGEVVEFDEGETPGWIVKQTRKCGDRSCKCYSGEEHGPYYYKYYRDSDGTLNCEYYDNKINK